MISDDVCALVEELLPVHARELQVSFDVSIGVQPMPTRDGGTVAAPAVRFLILCKSTLVGAPPFANYEMLPLEAALDRDELGKLLWTVCEHFRQRRAEELQIGGVL